MRSIATRGGVFLAGAAGCPRYLRPSRASCDELQSQYLLGFEPAARGWKLPSHRGEGEGRSPEGARAGGLCRELNHQAIADMGGDSRALLHFVLPFSLTGAASSLSSAPTRTSWSSRSRSPTAPAASYPALLLISFRNFRRRRSARSWRSSGTERVPVSLGILLDISGSMAPTPKARALDEARWADTRRALELLVQRLNPARPGLLRGVRRQGGAGGPVDARAPAGSALVRCASTRGLYGDVRRGQVDRAGV